MNHNCTEKTCPFFAEHNCNRSRDAHWIATHIAAIGANEAQDASFSVVRHTGSLATIDMFQLERREDRGYGWVPEHIKFIPRY